MEILCPSCQRKLTLPDEFAGQPAKCPMCGSAFTAPSLPTLPAMPMSPAPPAPPPPPVTVQAPPPPPEAPATFPLVAEAPSPYPPPAPVAVAPVPQPPPPPPPAPAPQPFPATTPAPTPTGEPVFRLGVTFAPNVLPWVAATAALLVFILTFFTWAGFYPGGLPARTQSAWQAAFGSQSVDKDIEKVVGKMLPPAKEGDKKDEGPGASGLLIVFLLLLIPTVLLTVASAVIGVASALPTAVQRLRPWRWGASAIAALVAFLFLGIQTATSLGVESKIHSDAERVLQSAQGLSEKEAELYRGKMADWVRRGAAMTWAVWLTFLVFLFAAMVFWMERSPHRPPPRLEFRW